MAEPERTARLNLSPLGTGKDAVVVDGMNLSGVVHRLLLTSQAGRPTTLTLELAPHAYVVDAQGSVVGVSPAGHAALVGLGWQPPGALGQVGRCGHASPVLLSTAGPATHCGLAAGHAGWHRDDDGAAWGTAVSGASLDGLLANIGRSLASAVDDAERAEAIEMLLDGWYAAWPDSAVTSPSFPLATQLVRLLGKDTAEMRAERDEAIAALRDAMAEVGDRTAEARGALSDYEELKVVNAELADQRDTARKELTSTVQQRDQLAELVDDMLREYTVHGRPGREAVRTPWLDPAKVQRWRRRRRELRPPDDPV
ncbi:hypothetical protein [Micromonospora aurantiaca (nom. illeg.)]|uniref:hypothetical protein n=1 Tax=Micromonospora aurantiaca (nom. illeg.) TaxID=47850 RepID=UPI001656FB56|nr:hypothetical protein [Micromonospora aurantiaca]MBC9006124.1 hypothetical protein [Micromonospora aurantiaca]